MYLSHLFKGFRASYIKPVQTGSPSDAGFVTRHAPATSRCTTLFDYTDPVSPHLAAARDGAVTPDTEIVEAVVAEIKVALGESDEAGDGAADGREAPAVEAARRRGGAKESSLVLVESAGGVLSPAPSGSLQADAFRPLRLPVLLVGDGKLGGIGATLSALESLRMRGYSVLGVALIAQGIKNACKRRRSRILVDRMLVLVCPDGSVFPPSSIPVSSSRKNCDIGDPHVTLCVRSYSSCHDSLSRSQQ